MSFSRHQKIYRSDLVTRELNSSSSPHGDHRFDESSTSYSSAGCSPAAPASASLANRSLALFSAAGNRSAANGNLSLISLSQPRGAVQQGRSRRRDLVCEAEPADHSRRENLPGRPTAADSRGTVERHDSLRAIGDLRDTFGEEVNNSRDYPGATRLPASLWG
jgi:hypothetical protein